MPNGQTVSMVPTQAELRRLGTGRPVSSSHGMRWSDELAFLLAHNVESVFDACFAEQSTSSTLAKIAYNRSPYVQALYVGVELVAAASGDYGTLGLSLSGASLIGQSQLDGTLQVYCPRAGIRVPSIHSGYLDVSGVTAGTTADLTVTWTPTTGGKGIYRIHVAEVPLLDVDPAGAPTTEAGINAAWPSPTTALQNRLVDGSSSTDRGFVRLNAQLDKARAEMRRHWQLCQIESTTYAWKRDANDGAGVFGQLNWVGGQGTAYDPKFRIRARRLYSTSNANSYTFRCRYRTTNAGDDAKVRIVINGTNNDLTLTGSTSFTSAVLAVTVPTSTANQEVEITFAAHINDNAAGASQVYFSQLCLIEAEV